MSDEHRSGLVPGRMVHYVARGSADGIFPEVCRAATITEVGGWVTTSAEEHPGAKAPYRVRTVTQRWDGLACTLLVMNPTGLFLNLVESDPGDPAEGAQGCRCAAGERAYQPGTWHWPERA